MTKPQPMYEYTSGQLNSHVLGVLPPVPEKVVPDGATRKQVIIQNAFLMPKKATKYQDDIRRAMIEVTPKEFRPPRKRKTYEYKGQKGETDRIKTRRAALLAAFDEWLAPMQAIRKIKVAGIDLAATDETLRGDILALTRSGKLTSKGKGQLRYLIQSDLVDVVKYLPPKPLGTTRALIERRKLYLRACMDWTQVARISDVPEIRRATIYEETKRLLRLGVIERKYDYATSLVRITDLGRKYLEDDE